MQPHQTTSWNRKTGWLAVMSAGVLAMLVIALCAGGNAVAQDDPTPQPDQGVALPALTVAAE
jgi:hypothetical protein